MANGQLDAASAVGAMVDNVGAVEVVLEPAFNLSDDVTNILGDMVAAANRPTRTGVTNDHSKFYIQSLIEAIGKEGLKVDDISEPATSSKTGSVEPTAENGRIALGDYILEKADIGKDKIDVDKYGRVLNQLVRLKLHPKLDPLKLSMGDELLYGVGIKGLNPRILTFTGPYDEGEPVVGEVEKQILLADILTIREVGIEGTYVDHLPPASRFSNEDNLLELIRRGDESVITGAFLIRNILDAQKGREGEVYDKIKSEISGAISSLGSFDEFKDGEIGPRRDRFAEIQAMGKGYTNLAGEMRTAMDSLISKIPRKGNTITKDRFRNVKETDINTEQISFFEEVSRDLDEVLAQLGKVFDYKSAILNNALPDYEVNNDDKIVPLVRLGEIRSRLAEMKLSISRGNEVGDTSQPEIEGLKGSLVEMLERLGNVDVDGFESKLAYYVPADMYSKEGSQADRSELLKFMIRVGLDQEQVFTAYTNAMIHSAERRLQREVYTYSGRFTK